MTPEEHYQRGVELLAEADEMHGFDPDSRAAQVAATLAVGHLTACISAGSRHASEVITHPAVGVIVQTSTPVATDHMWDGVADDA